MACLPGVVGRAWVEVVPTFCHLSNRNQGLFPLAYCTGQNFGPDTPFDVCLARITYKIDLRPARSHDHGRQEEEIIQKKRASRSKKATRASDTRNQLDCIPVELFCLVTEQCGLSIRDLVHLALTSRSCYEKTIPAVYKKHVKEDFGIAMYWALKNERFSTLERLFENGANINLNTELQDIFKKFENTRAYIDVPSDESAFTPLGWAASLGLDNMVQYLLDHGADIEQPSVSMPVCACSGFLLMNQLDMPSGPIFMDGTFSDEPYWTPIHFAICQGHESTTKLLITRGASVTEIYCDEDGTKCGGVTALHAATRWGRENIIDYLLDNKLVDINAQSCQGVTALHIAYVAERFSLVDKYLDLGADINRTWRGCGDGEQRWNIFAMACADDRLDKALQYLQRGADPGFIITVNHEPWPWTAMRFIYEHGATRSVHPLLAKVRERIALEQEIFKASGGRPPTRA